jgi:hypothetical protein
MDDAILDPVEIDDLVLLLVEFRRPVDELGARWPP